MRVVVNLEVVVLVVVVVVVVFVEAVGVMAKDSDFVPGKFEAGGQRNYWQYFQVVVAFLTTVVLQSTFVSLPPPHPAVTAAVPTAHFSKHYASVVSIFHHTLWLHFWPF